MIVKPLQPSWKRLRKILKTDFSLYRYLEYEILSGKTLEGKILDLGGGNNNGYLEYFDVKGEYESANISDHYKPTYLCDFNEALPFETGSYDTAISLNTFEHIYNIDLAVEEMMRILKPDGKFLIAMPFLFRVHGSPDDYHRKTASWWITKLEECGVDTHNINIELIIWDQLGSGFALTEGFSYPFVPWRVTRTVRRFFYLFYGVLRNIFKGDSQTDLNENALKDLSPYPLGYIITGKKKAS